MKPMTSRPSIAISSQSAALVVSASSVSATVVVVGTGAGVVAVVVVGGCRGGGRRGRGVGPGTELGCQGEAGDGENRAREGDAQEAPHGCSS